jgi:hypothetical protein
MPISLGSSLIAKSKPGGKYRDIVEQNVENPALPGKGQIGTIARSQVEEPLERPVPQGSEKIVSVQPTVEGSTVAQNSILPAGGVGLPDAANTPLRSGAGNQALFSGGGSSRSAAAPSQAPGRVNPGGATVSNRAAVTPTAARAYAPAYDFSQENQQVRSQQPQYERTNFASALSTLGNKAYADAGKAVQKVISYTPTAGQYLQGAAGKVLSQVPALRSLGNQLQSQGGSRAVGNTSGSISKFVQSIVPNTVKQTAPVVRSVQQVAKTVTSAVNNLLRSLTGGKKK